MRRHVEKVLGGEYEVPYRATKPVILDIGAQCREFRGLGAEALAGAHVHCYEPLPDNFALLKKNLGQIEGSAVQFEQFRDR